MLRKLDGGIAWGRVVETLGWLTVIALLLFAASLARADTIGCNPAAQINSQGLECSPVPMLEWDTPPNGEGEPGTTDEVLGYRVYWRQVDDPVGAWRLLVDRACFWHCDVERDPDGTCPGSSSWTCWRTAWW